VRRHDDAKNGNDKITNGAPTRLDPTGRNDASEATMSRTQQLRACAAARPTFPADKTWFTTQANKSVPEVEFLDDAAITLNIVPRQETQQFRAAADHHQKASPRGVVFLMRLEMLGEQTNSLREQRNLNLRAAAVVRALTKTFDKLTLAHCIQSHL
jgi:hypothetical protein